MWTEVNRSLGNSSNNHDHKHKQVRGLLCIRCNLGIGCFGDNPKLLKKAIKYLEKHEKA